MNGENNFADPDCPDLNEEDLRYFTGLAEGTDVAEAIALMRMCSGPVPSKRQLEELRANEKRKHEAGAEMGRKAFERNGRRQPGDSET